MSENGGNVVPADCVRPGFKKGFDPGLFGVGVFRHGFGSFVRSEDEQRSMNPTRARGHAAWTWERRKTARRTASVGRSVARRGVPKRRRALLDADIRRYFDSIDRDWLRRMLAHRIAEPRVLRLIGQWLRAGHLPVPPPLWSPDQILSAFSGQVK
jgi:hypothetical protein